MVKAKVWRIEKMFDGFPKDGDLKLEEEELPDLENGEMLLEALYLSVDPYMRLFIETQGKVGGIMFGEQISKVVESKNDNFPTGTVVRSHSGWRTHTIITPRNIIRMPELGDLPLSTVLGVMGMPGMTAYFSFLDICRPKEGETVVINSAAGCVGSLFGQIAKIKGCKTIGFAGREEKCEWLKEIGFDYAYNYKTVKLDDALKEAAPDGVDCYLDNVGGEFTLNILKHMKTLGRMAIVGEISQYNASQTPRGEVPFSTILFKQLTVQGFANFHTTDRWPEAEEQMKEWIKQGKIKYKETIIDGFKNMYTAFRGLFTGSNIGKAVVKC